MDLFPCHRWRLLSTGFHQQPILPAIHIPGKAQQIRLFLGHYQANLWLDHWYCINENSPSSSPPGALCWNSSQYSSHTEANKCQEVRVQAQGHWRASVNVPCPARCPKHVQPNAACHHQQAEWSWCLEQGYRPCLGWLPVNPQLYFHSSHAHFRAHTPPCVWQRPSQYVWPRNRGGVWFHTEHLVPREGLENKAQVWLL